MGCRIIEKCVRKCVRCSNPPVSYADSPLYTKGPLVRAAQNCPPLGIHCANPKAPSAPAVGTPEGSPLGGLFPPFLSAQKWGPRRDRKSDFQVSPRKRRKPPAGCSLLPFCSFFHLYYTTRSRKTEISSTFFPLFSSLPPNIDITKCAKA